MRIPRIYTTQDLSSQQTIKLEEKPSHHLSKVLRFKEGAELILFNGQGGQYSGEISAIEKKHVHVALSSFDADNNESPLSTHLGIAISKGDRMDWVIQKATELGATQITPLFSERTEIKLKGERLEKKLNHWQQISISACEQCNRNKIATVHAPQNIEEWIANSTADKRFVLHHRTDQKLDSNENINSVALLIGPEGGLSQHEIQHAQNNKFEALQLGPRVLRTETAPIAALTLLQFLWGDL
jgi:16S rRNA (uracil1498-N3)-methyltransferase